MWDSKTFIVAVDDLESGNTMNLKLQIVISF